MKPTFLYDVVTIDPDWTDQKKAELLNEKAACGYRLTNTIGNTHYFEKMLDEDQTSYTCNDCKHYSNFHCNRKRKATGPQLTACSEFEKE